MESAEILLRLKRATEEAKEVHSQLAFTVGQYYGYPLCCRINFSDDILRDRDPTDRNVDGSGFIPCRKHYLEIKAGKAVLADLIENRICHEPFTPNT